MKSTVLKLIVVGGAVLSLAGMGYADESLTAYQQSALDRGEALPIDRSDLKNLVLPVRSPFEIETGYVSRHDIVYQSPNFGPYEGFPMGNGDLGGMIWTTDEGIGVQINKSNTIDKDPKRYGLQSVARLQVRLGTPAFEWLQLDDFEGRLSLHDATARYSAKTQYMSTKVDAITCSDRNVWMITLSADLVDQFMDSLKVSVELDRYGSRAHSMFFGKLEPNYPEALGDTKISIRDHDVILKDKLEQLNVVTALRVVGADSTPEILNKRRGSLSFRLQSKQQATLLIAVATSEDAKDPLAETKVLLDRIEQAGVEQVKQQHAQWWQDFWKRSFVHLDDDYLENLYHMRRYVMAAGSRANFPILFNGGLWLWNRDVRNWNLMTHWNQLNTYVGLQAQNDCDLMMTNLDHYWRLMPKAEEEAKKLNGIDDAILMPEANDARMYRTNHRTSFTVAPHIARFYLKQYEYTQDRKFLENYAYPYAKKAAEFYLKYLTWDSKLDRYTIFPARPYECGHHKDGEEGPYKDTITDLSMIQYLFPKMIEFSTLLNVDSDKREQWQHVLDHLWDPPVVNWPGYGEVYSEVFDKRGKPWPQPEDEINGGRPYFGRRFHFSACTALGFPGDIVDIDDAGTPEYDMLNRLLEIHPDQKNTISMDPIVAARLGNDKQLLRFFANSIKYDQHFPQGFFYNLDYHSLKSPRYSFDKEGETKFLRDYIYYQAPGEAKIGNKPLFRRNQFAQMAMESMSIQAAAVNEMLLQSHDGKVRVFPATPMEWESAFVLRASGGFMVSANKEKNRAPDSVLVSSHAGNTFNIINPWKDEPLEVVDAANNQKVDFTQNGELISFKTREGHSYSIKPENIRLSRKVFKAEPNAAPKLRGDAFLGKRRDF